MTVATTEPRRERSPATMRARADVAAHRAEASRLGRAAGDLVGNPADLVISLRDGLVQLEDAAYREELERVAPGIGRVAAVRQPLLRVTADALLRAMRQDRSSTVLDVAQHLLRADLLELHWIGFRLLERAIRENPERTWQLARAAARGADNWITVDALAHVAARGILIEPYRWAELEQLVYSPSRWERRLVGSTVATIPATDPVLGRSPDVARHGLALVRDLVGDAEPDVQKALSWALRTLTAVDEAPTVAFLRAEATAAARDDDGHRAWVIRDTLEKLSPAVAEELRSTLGTVRRRADAPSTSRAAETAAAFVGLGVTVPPAERPIVERP